MSPEHHPAYDHELNGAMQRSMSRESHDEIVREALRRVDGAPAPEIGVMQASMGREARVRATATVIRDYLDRHGFADTASWAKDLAERAAAERG